MSQDPCEQDFRAFEQRLYARRPHPADLGATELVHPDEFLGEPARPRSAKEQAYACKWWSEVLGYNEEREWIEIRTRGSVPLEEVREALCEAALTYDDLVAGGMKKTTALELTSETVGRRPRSGGHVVQAKTVVSINAIIERRNGLEPDFPQADTIPLELDVERRVPVRAATDKSVANARSRRRRERQLAPPAIDYPREQDWIGGDPLDDPRDESLYRTARLLGVRWGESCSVIHRRPSGSMEDHRAG